MAGYDYHDEMAYIQRECEESERAECAHEEAEEGIPPDVPAMAPARRGPCRCYGVLTHDVTCPAWDPREVEIWDAMRERVIRDAARRRQ